MLEARLNAKLNEVNKRCERFRQALSLIATGQELSKEDLIKFAKKTLELEQQGGQNAKSCNE